MVSRAHPNVLLVYPRFAGSSFWNYRATCEIVGARYSAAPLGLITVAALLPREWNLRLVNRNTEELAPGDLAWADVVLTGGMLPQQRDTLNLVALAHAAGRPVVVGGPDVTASPRVYDEADFVVLGEAEDCLATWVDLWRRGRREPRVIRADGFPDLQRSPVPRFDLLKLEHYLHVGVQFSRGCPYDCEFCNVIELNGRAPRVKSTAQMLGELEALRALGYRGHVDFVDDNMIGHRRAIKPFLAELARWLRANRYPFEFSTEASLNVADDAELLDLMKRANFFAIFIGIETTDDEALRQARKQHNAGRDLGESIRAIHRAGIFVNAGYIVGFDSEPGSVADAMIASIEATAIPVCMVGLLYALPGTQLHRRLAREGRLHANSDKPQSDADADQCTSGLNFETYRPRQHILRDYREVLRRIYTPAAYYGRVRRTVRHLDVRGHRLRLPWRGVRRDLRAFGRIVVRVGLRDRRVRAHFWASLLYTLVRNPRAAKTMVSFAALFLHFELFARHLDELLALRMEEPSQPPRVRPAVPSSPMLPDSPIPPISTAPISPALADTASPPH